MITAYALRDYAAGVAMVVFAPDYYEGPWAVHVGNQRRTCPNYTTALAWANYLRRRGFWYTTIGKVIT